MSLLTQAKRILQFTSPVADSCILTQFSGEERINGLFSFGLHLLAKDTPITAEKLLGQSVNVHIEYGEHTRYFHGIINEFSDLGGDNDGTLHYSATLVPKLWLLNLSGSNRFFENKTTVDIVKEVVSGSGCGEQIDTSKLRTYQKRELTTQYNETDLEFIHRLLAEDGIAYYFRQEAGKCTLTLIDGMQSFAECSPLSCLYDAYSGTAAAGQVSALTVSNRIRTRKLASTDYGEYAPATFPVKGEGQTKPKSPKFRHGTLAVHGSHHFERSDDSARLHQGGLAGQQTQKWMDGMEADANTLSGSSTCVMFCAGYRFQLKDAPEVAGGDKFLLSSVFHSAADGNDTGTHYSNSFGCVLTSNAQAFTPPPPAARPPIYGVHTAKVAKVKNPESPGATAEVKVKFPWNSEQSSCWARVAQLYAGNKWGSYFVPDVDQEVLVEFLNGDPDRPVVMGALYNKQNMIVPYTDTQSGIRSQRCKGEYNELRFDDKKGAEEVYFQAGKDHNYLVKNNQTGEVKQNRTVKITQGNDQLDINSGSQTVNIKAGSQTVKAGQSITLEANQSITLKVGGSSITIDPMSITLKSTNISIKGNAMTDVSGSAMLELKGGIVKIN